MHTMIKKTYNLFEDKLQEKPAKKQKLQAHKSFKQWLKENESMSGEWKFKKPINKIEFR